MPKPVWRIAGLATGVFTVLVPSLNYQFCHGQTRLSNTHACVEICWRIKRDVFGSSLLLWRRCMADTCSWVQWMAIGVYGLVSNQTHCVSCAGHYSRIHALIIIQVFTAASRRQLARSLTYLLSPCCSVNGRLGNQSPGGMPPFWCV